MQPLERRKHKRIRRTCTIRFRPLQDGAGADKTTAWEVVTMQNLSASGMLFTSTKKISTGLLFEFNISSPFIAQPIHCIGQVIRVEERQASKISVALIPVYSISIFFKNIGTDKEEAIKKICGDN